MSILQLFYILSKITNNKTSSNSVLHINIITQIVEEGLTVAQADRIHLCIQLFNHCFVACCLLSLLSKPGLY